MCKSLEAVHQALILNPVGYYGELKHFFDANRGTLGELQAFEEAPQIATRTREETAVEKIR